MRDEGGDPMRRIIGIVLAVLGVLAFVGSFVWRSSVEPKLVKYPTDVDETPEYAGTVTIYLDPKTYAPLATPIEARLTVSRHIRALGDQSSSNRVVLSEEISLTAKGQFSGNLDSQYVMNRKTMRNVDNDRAWAFSPDNRVDRSPAYRLAFPFDTPVRPYNIYNNNIEATYTAQPAGQGEVEGLTVENFKAELPRPTPISAAYLAALNKLNPLPTQLTLAQLKPILKQAGIDIDALLPALLPNLAPADTQALLALAQKPIKLDYLYTFSGSDAVEPSTGSIVEVKDVVETIYAAPDPTVLPQLKAILDKYPNVPAAVDASAALAKLAANPIKVFENKYSQTPASVADIASTVKDKRTLKHLAQSTIPNTLLIGGIVLAVLGVVLAAVPRKKPSEEVPTEAPAEAEAVAGTESAVPPPGATP
jgi:Porin PorA